MKRTKWRLVVVWTILGLAYAATLSREATRWTFAAAMFFAVVATLSGRTSLYLHAYEPAASGRAYRFWRLLYIPAALVALVYALVLGLLLQAGTSARLLFASAVLLSFIGLVLAARWPRPSLQARKSTRLSLLVVDTALPLAVIAAVSGAAVFMARSSGDSVSSQMLTRHFAGSALLYGIFAGFGGALKIGRELGRGAVVLPHLYRASVPGPVTLGLMLFIAILLAAPRLLPAEVDRSQAWMAKAALSFCVAFASAMLGGLRAQKHFAETKS